MKVVIAGSRSINDPSLIPKAVTKSNFNITEVISGHAGGVDRMGERWARGVGIPITVMPADWLRFGRQAGMLRNIRMLEVADALIAIWDGKSPGTSQIISEAKKRGLPYFTYIV